MEKGRSGKLQAGEPRVCAQEDLPKILLEITSRLVRQTGDLKQPEELHSFTRSRLCLTKVVAFNNGRMASLDKRKGNRSYT